MEYVLEVKVLRSNTSRGLLYNRQKVFAIKLHGSYLPPTNQQRHRPRLRPPYMGKTQYLLNNKDVTVVLTDGPTTTTTDNDEHSSRLKNTVDRLSLQVKKAPMEHRRVITAQKRTTSWAEIARNGIRQ